MIEINKGNLLEANAEALVNTVNCVGFMGKGIALQFKQAFLANYRAYEAACRADEVVPGKMLVYDNGRLLNPRYIINFPTKRHWRGKSRVSDIKSGLKALVKDVQRLELHSIAVPPLGCGLGGLDWREVRPLIEEAFRELPPRQPPAPKAPSLECATGIHARLLPLSRSTSAPLGSNSIRTAGCGECLTCRHSRSRSTAGCGRTPGRETFSWSAPAACFSLFASSPTFGARRSKSEVSRRWAAKAPGSALRLRCGMNSSYAG